MGTMEQCCDCDMGGVGSTQQAAPRALRWEPSGGPAGAVRSSSHLLAVAALLAPAAGRSRAAREARGEMTPLTGYYRVHATTVQGKK